jgi:hypothetical protein
MPLPCIGHRQTRAFGRHHAARRIAFLLLSGLFLATTSAAAARAQNAPSVLQTTGGPIAAHVTEAAERFSIPEHWIRAIMQTESAGDRSAISSAGAMGLMQVMPDTWTELRLRYGFGSDPFAQRDNILAGTAYLREMLDRYSNIGAMLGAYVAALVPLLGGEPLPHNLANASPSVTDWRDAGLFAVSASSPETAPGLHGERYASGTLAAPTSHHNPLVPAQPDALFPVRTSQGARP